MDRLEAIVSLVDKCDTVADIGTDHGYVTEMVLKKRLCNKVIATDINRGPLSSAINHLTDIKLDDMVEFRLGAGLTVLNQNEVDCLVIAGMGGELISSILEQSKDVAKSIGNFILQPMTNIDVLRKYLCDNGYKTIKEVIVKEYHHYYFILKVENGAEKHNDEIFYEISKYLYDNKDLLLLEYIKKLTDTNSKILINLENSKKQDNYMKIEEIKNKIISLERMVKQYECQ